MDRHRGPGPDFSNLNGVQSGAFTDLVPAHKKADFIHTNAFYIGNNQFVNDERINVLEDLMEEFF